MSPYLEDDHRVLTPEVFGVVLGNELKRAVRSQSYLTLLVIEANLLSQRPSAEADVDETTRERAEAVRQIARLVASHVRETDLLSQTDDGELSIVLLDADLHNAMRVVDRFMARLHHYQFTRPLTIGVGAAACPTQGADTQSLRRSAKVRTVHPLPDVDARSQ
jgi:hypothetical protein